MVSIHRGSGNHPIGCLLQRGALVRVLGIASFLCLLKMVCQEKIYLESALSSALSSSDLKDDTETKDQASYKSSYKEYIPASTEDYIMTNMVELGFDKEMWAVGCKIFESPANTTETNYNNLHAFRKDLDIYNQVIEDFDGGNATKNLLKTIRSGEYDDLSQVCKQLRPHPDGIQALFPSQQVSFTQAGYVEPLLTPMRNPKFCDNTRKMRFDIDYIVHDFEAMCMKLKPKSRTVLIDMGAALDFHNNGKQPIISLMKKYEKFGFYFDHIYAFEIAEKDPKKVYQESLPKEYFTSYHWINAGKYIIS